MRSCLPLVAKRASNTMQSKLVFEGFPEMVKFSLNLHVSGVILGQKAHLNIDFELLKVHCNVTVSELGLSLSWIELLLIFK